MFYNSFINISSIRYKLIFSITSYILTSRSKIFKREQVFHMVVSHISVSVPNNCVPYKSVSADSNLHLCVFQRNMFHMYCVCVSVEDCVPYSETQEGGDKLRNALAIPGRLLIHRNTWNLLSKERETEIRFLKSF